MEQMEEEPVQPLPTITIPPKLQFLLEKHRYKVAYGGRGGAKSHTFSKVLLALGAAKPMRILCAREVQRSIRDSVHALLSDQVKAIGIEHFYQVLDTEIRGLNGTIFIFSGLANHTVDSIKSYEGIDVCWVEEAHNVTRRSWDILIPTIRKDESEIWISFNPDMEDDETYQRFVVSPPEDAVVVKMNYWDNDWWPPVLEKERLEFKRKRSKEDYGNIYLGNPRTTIVGAIYANEVMASIDARRFSRVPYDPRFPVHTFWDLGWNDQMTIIMVQKVAPSVLNVVNYYEDNFRTYADVVGELDKLPYRWGQDNLPHDGGQRDPKSGSSAEMVLRRLGRRLVKVWSRHDPEEGIRQARMVFPRVYVDDSVRTLRDGGYLGGGRLIECLRKYKRHVPRATPSNPEPEPNRPEHDEYSHGADAWRLMCVMADKIVNPEELREMSTPRLPGYQFDLETGVLG